MPKCFLTIICIHTYTYSSKHTSFLEELYIIVKILIFLITDTETKYAEVLFSRKLTNPSLMTQINDYMMIIKSKTC